MSMLFIDMDLFAEKPPVLPISDEQYQINCTYFNEQLSQYQQRLSQACSRRAANRMKTEFSQYTTREFMERLGQDWKGFFDTMAQIYCHSCILSQLRFSPLAYRSKFTRALFEEKMQICGLTDSQFTESLQKDLERAGVMS